MVLKALFLLIILYYVVRASRALIRAVQTDGQGTRPNSLRADPPPSAGWQGPAPERRRSEANIEDAKWVDL